jgi:hypothetical protein
VELAVNDSSQPIDPRITAILRAYPFHREGEAPPEPPPELIEGLLPEVGAALLAGQWGTFKSFILLDLVLSVTTGLPFAGRRVMRRGGALILAAEGQQYIPVRLRWIRQGKATVEPDERLPILWINSCPKLTGKDALLELLVLANAAGAEFQHDFGLPLALVGIDAMTSAAGFADADNTAEVSRVMRVLNDFAFTTQALALVLDHFGKDPSTGTRNSSVKEDDVESVLAILANRTQAGVVSNTRLVLRKYRGGPTGAEISFDKRVLDGDGIVIAWSEQEEQGQASTKPDNDRWPPSLVYLKGALSETLGKLGFVASPYLDNLTVRVVKREHVRDEYMRRHPDADGKNKAQKFRRHVDAAIANNCMTSREITLPDGLVETVFWAVKPC